MSETRIYLNSKRRSHIYRLTYKSKYQDGPAAHVAWCGMFDTFVTMEPSTAPTKPLCKNCTAILEAMRSCKRIEATGDETVELPLFNVGIDEEWLRTELEDVEVTP